MTEGKPSVSTWKKQINYTHIYKIMLFHFTERKAAEHKFLYCFTFRKTKLLSLISN